MSTPAQLTANRLNSQASTGPVTDPGKKASSQNARKHGLSGAFSLLPAEDPDQFNALLNRLTEEMRPVTEHECFLVDRITQARWKLERIRGIEEELLDRTLGGDAVGHQLSLIMRYSAAAERTYYRAQKEFTQSRREQEKNTQAAFKTTLDNYLLPPAGHAKATIVQPNYPESGSFRKTDLTGAAMTAPVALRI